MRSETSPMINTLEDFEQRQETSGALETPLRCLRAACLSADVMKRGGSARIRGETLQSWQRLSAPKVALPFIKEPKSRLEPIHSSQPGTTKGPPINNLWSYHYVAANSPDKVIKTPRLTASHHRKSANRHPPRPDPAPGTALREPSRPTS